MSLLISPLKRLLAPIGTGALLIFASSVPGAAQVVYPYYPPVHYMAPDAAVKFDVKPKNAAVYLDGFYAGIVDDYDGTFQRLYTAPGGHEITVYLEGYRTFTQRAYLTPDHTFKVRHMMEKLAVGEVAEKPPAPPIPLPDEQQPPPGPRGPYGRRGLPPPNAPQPPPGPPSSSSDQGPARGTLALHVQPPDAEVLVDGQPWRGSGQESLTIDLSEGRHNVQIRKPGYVGYLTDVQIRRGESTSLDVNLRTQP